MEVADEEGLVLALRTLARREEMAGPSDGSWEGLRDRVEQVGRALREGVGLGGEELGVISRSGAPAAKVGGCSRSGVPERVGSGFLRSGR